MNNQVAFVLLLGWVFKFFIPGDKMKKSLLVLGQGLFPAADPFGSVLCSVSFTSLTLRDLDCEHWWV